MRLTKPSVKYRVPAKSYLSVSLYPEGMTLFIGSLIFLWIEISMLILKKLGTYSSERGNQSSCFLK